MTTTHPCDDGCGGRCTNMEVWGEIWEVRGVGSGWDWVSGGEGLEGGLIYCSDLSDCDLRVAGAKAFTEIIIGKSINPNNVCWDRFI